MTGGENDYQYRRIADLEHRVKALEALIVSAAKNVVIIEDRLTRLSRMVASLQAVSHTQTPGEIEP